METDEVLKQLQGSQTIESIQEKLDISRKNAIQRIHRFRKEGYVKTRATSNKKRIYHISKKHKLGGISYIEIINKYSPIILSESHMHKIYGRTPSLEETLIYAIRTNNIRVIVAALSLFRHIRDWTLLGKIAREHGVQRAVGALYDVARNSFRVRRMDGHLRNSILPKKTSTFSYMIQGFKSKDFQHIENRWKVYIPLNKEDLHEYRRK